MKFILEQDTNQQTTTNSCTLDENATIENNLLNENELKKRAKYHKKMQKGLSAYCFLNPDAGNVEHNIEMFNQMTSPVESSNAESTTVVEDFDYDDLDIKISRYELDIPDLINFLMEANKSDKISNKEKYLKALRKVFDILSNVIIDN